MHVVKLGLYLLIKPRVYWLYCSFPAYSVQSTSFLHRDLYGWLLTCVIDTGAFLECMCLHYM